MYIALGIIVVLLLILAFMYNSMINKRNQVDYAWANIDVQLKKRTDLIPNLVSSAKQYMDHEKGVLADIVRLRNSVHELNDKSAERMAAEGQLSQALGQLAITVENYPDLKANDNFQMLMRSLNEVESQISASRRAFNGSVLSLNNAIQMFPTNIMASIMGMQLETPFEALPEERKNVNVEDLFNK